ncbi:CDP-glucose 4,6-dehydratase [Rhizobium sp. Root1220]|uniref:CDP-glucose 4,6-dehydratase n=1 Tax=Rhizobium sp. Root1220 TaxID=1736432 RepID=UPI0006F6F79C|nr:CDP-glucose 4,6-dehydratase [Rhizobium sp. Root1220]KQV84491.1 CDP-glucose 4,6-dehydratase [Rhizobium sp. Root1220]
MSRLPDPRFWAGKRVFLTGHTGFKGTWARIWLSKLGARVTGYALAPATTPSLHALAGSWGLEAETIADIRDGTRLGAALQDCNPDIILHMAAQPLVRRSYAEPDETFDVNVMGTVRLLEASRSIEALKAVLVVTTDKVYSNDESGRHFVETDRLGGHDPYSGSKAAAEIATATYRDSFFRQKGVHVGTARGGNVLGGGDFSEDRLVPDIVRAAIAGEILDIRSPLATRPWQHVLDCLNGYFLFSEALFAAKPSAEALNFGPSPAEAQIAVGAVASAVQVAMGLGETWRDTSSADKPREMQTLGLDPAEANRSLAWRACLSQAEAIDLTARWYDQWRRGGDALALVTSQIDDFVKGSQRHVS